MLSMQAALGCVKGEREREIIITFYAVLKLTFDIHHFRKTHTPAASSMRV
jgi:hypothetical protein